MKPVDQLYTPTNMDEHPVGDCWRCCIASILELPAEKVPHFTELDDDTPERNWWSQSRKFVQEFKPGLDMYFQDTDRYPETMLSEDEGVNLFEDPGAFGLTPGKMYWVAMWVILTGKSPRGDWLHSVVWDMSLGKMVHDPHPSRDGILDLRSIAVMAIDLEPEK